MGTAALACLALCSGSGSAAAGEISMGPRLVDATQLSVAELLSMAAEERTNASWLKCCDWGGPGCTAEAKPEPQSAKPRDMSLGITRVNSDE
ncbi:MAG: hypothetical protein QNJ16_11055 [Rhodobacter sp.]|nr:hypothetical protein [Rhodobacter sp.]